MHNAVAAADPVATAVANGRYVTVAGTVRTYPKISAQTGFDSASDSTYTAQLDVHQIKIGDTAFTSHASLRITWPALTGSAVATAAQQAVQLREPITSIARGETVVLSGKATETFPGDVTAGQLRVQKIHSSAPAHLWHRATNSIHEAMMRELAGRRPSAALIPGVVMGDNSRLAPDLIANMRTLGLAHLTAVSGAHVSIVLAAALATIGGRRPRLAGSASLIMLAGLMLLVGPQPSVLRAGMMAAFVCVAVMARRPSSALPLLSLTVIVFSLADPTLARSLGFRLSVVATGAIVIFGYRLRQRLSAGMPRVLAEVISLPLIAGLATLPLLVGVQKTASVWTVVANAAVAPIVAPLMLAGLMGALILPVFPAVAAPLLALCEVCAWWLERVTQTLMSWPGSGVTLQNAFAINLLVLLVLIVGSRMRKTVAAVMLLSSCALLATASSYSQLAGGIPENWQAVQCNVGQGSAFLVRVPSGVVLIDVGPGNGNIADCLRRARVRELDLVVLSHYDADHVRGLDKVLATTSVRQIWVSANREPVAGYQWVRQQAAAQGIPVHEVKVGDGMPGLEIVGPHNVRGGRENTNADSLVVALQTTDGLRILVLSDSPGERQAQLQITKPVHAVVVGHHGAADQSEKLAAQLRPGITLFSVGENKYGHPTLAALRIWQAPIQRRTDQCGHIALTTTEVVSKCE
ncbi:MAG: ComEC/Rec2 family competence protein [Trueperella sp.]|nr:ComEC/Rec2 family competence protein [Trueperella sp.]